MFIRRLHKKKQPQKRRRKDDATTSRNVLDEDSSSAAESEIDADVPQNEQDDDTTKTVVIRSASLSNPVTLHSSPAPMTCVAMSAVDGSVWTGDKKGVVHMITRGVDGHAVVTMPSPHRKHVLCVAVSAPIVGQSLAVTGSKDGDIRVWNPQTGTLVGNLSFHRVAVTGLAFRTETNTMYSVSADRSLAVWGVTEMMQIDTFYGHTSTILAVAGNMKEACVAGGEDRIPRYFKTDSGKHNVYSAQKDSIECLAMIKDDTYVVGTSNGTLSAYTTGKSSALCSREFAHSYGFIGDGTGLEQFAPPAPAETPTNFNGNAIWAMCSVPQTNVVVTGSCDGYIRFWRVSDGAVTEVGYETVPGVVTGLAVSKDGTTLVACVSREPRLGRWVTWSTVDNAIIQWTLKCE
eukprot:PhM_4_TR13393/c0_g1_i1/m.7091/K14793/RRP9; ribosomal RNA-processing protein 9